MTSAHYFFLVPQLTFGAEATAVQNGTFLKDYIEFFHGNTCRSFAGRSGQKQEIFLSPRCAEEHTLIHEVTCLEKFPNHGCNNITLLRKTKLVL